MVNFRYHLVSLIAVFVALTLGVILGAGPLQTRLGDAFSQDSSTSSADVSQQLTQAKTELDQQSKVFAAIGDQVLPGTLDGVAVATVALPGADEQVVKDVRTELQTAGADLVGEVSLTNNWDSQAMDSYRESLSTPVATHLSTPASADDTADSIIGHAVVEVLTSTGSEQDLLKDILTADETPILSLEVDPKGSAQALVVIGGTTSTDATTDASDDAESASSAASAPSAWVGLAGAVAQAPSSGVVLGDASTQTSMISQIRAANVGVTTVDSVGTQLGALNVALALPSAGTTARALGIGEGAQSALADLPHGD